MRTGFSPTDPRATFTSTAHSAPGSVATSTEPYVAAVTDAFTRAASEAAGVGTRSLAPALAAGDAEGATVRVGVHAINATASTTAICLANVRLSTTEPALYRRDENSSGPR